MKENIWTYLFALISIGFGWLLSELGQWLRGRKDDRRAKKKVLFYLLELYFNIKSLDTTPYIKIVTKKIGERLPKDQQDNEFERHLSSFYQQIIGNFNERQTAEKINQLENNYIKSLEDLSSVDPITSYRLLGKTDFFNLLNILSQYCDSIKDEFQNDKAEIDTQMESIMQFIKPEYLSSTLEILEKEIKSISISIGLITRFRSRRVLKSLAKPIEKNSLIHLTAYLDKFMPRQ